MNATAFTCNELLVTELARHLRDDEIGFVGVGTSGRAFSLVVGVPLVAGRLVQLTSAPHFDLQIGPIIGPEMDEMPSRWNDSTVYSWAASGLLDGADNLDIFANGGVDVGFVSGAQIDRFGNLNVTWIDRDGERAVRLIGCLALPEHHAFAQRSIILADLSPRGFVPRVDYVTGVGFLDGGTSRADAGLFDRGPVLVLTDRATFDFEPASKEMRLRTLHPGFTTDDVLGAMGFRPLVPDSVPTTQPPDAETLRLIREVIDPEHLLLAHEPESWLGDDGRRR